MNDPKYFEKFLYIDSINDYNSIIEECRKKLYDSTPATIRARSLRTMKRAQRELAKTQAEYEIFKRYKAITAISR
jgi:hypothetical protein